MIQEGSGSLLWDANKVRNRRPMWQEFGSSPLELSGMANYKVDKKTEKWIKEERGKGSSKDFQS